MNLITLALSVGVVGIVSSVNVFAAPRATAISSPREAQFQGLLAQYDRAIGAERDRLALEVDKAAGQRYATTSRLYWHQDLAEAKAAAIASGKPILSLRMLGRLDEDDSCANSRLFRATLYANKEIREYLRANFVLHWSMERPVPKVTIDMGDGRQIKTTITGNSAHYILAPDGSVMDVLPGVYAPRPFLAELGKSLAFAKKTMNLAVGPRTAALANHHRQEYTGVMQKGTTLAPIAYLPNAGSLTTDAALDSAAWAAQRSTMSKAVVEVPLLAQISVGQIASLDASSTAAWGALAQQWWGERASAPTGAPIRRAPPATDKPRPAPTPVLDDASRALVVALHDGGGRHSTEGERALMLARLELTVMADAALNELRLRQDIRRLLMSGETDFTRVNSTIYAQVFKTPASDPWIGLAPRTDFSGLPGDGLVERLIGADPRGPAAARTANR